MTRSCVPARDPGGSDVPHARVLPLSRVQTGFWLRETLSGVSERLAFGLDFDRQIPLGRLDRALSAVVARHPLLRGRFAFGPAGLGLSVEPAPDSIVTRLPPAEGAVDEWCEEPLSLRSWPPCRAAVAVDGDQTRLRVVAHHAVFDGESKEIFLRDLVRAYRGDPLTAGGATPLDAPFWRALVERERHAGAAGAQPDASGATDRRGPRSLRGSGRRESLDFLLDPCRIALVDQAARRLEVSKFTIYLATWHATLARLQTSDADVVTAIALSTRDKGEADEIGPFVKQAPVASMASSQRSLGALALELSESVHRVARNRLQPPPRRAPADGARPDVVVSYRRSALGDLDWPDATAIPVLLPRSPAAMGSDVVVRMVHDGRITAGMIDVDRSTLPPGFAVGLRRCWLALLDAGTRDLDVPVAALALDQGSS
jgi:hypothetical protein